MFVAIHEYTAQVGPEDWERVRDTLLLDGTETIAKVMGWASAHHATTSIRIELTKASTAKETT